MTSDGHTSQDVIAPREVPRISVVIPSYNATAFLQRAITSVRAQTARVHEVIVVDDCSKDGSAELATDLGVHVVRQETNKGPSAARNAGVMAAQGELIAFLDADDCWLPAHCATLTKALHDAPGTVLATGLTASEAARPARDRRPPSGQSVDALPWLLRSNFVTQSAAMVLRTALLDVGGYEPTMRHSEDYHLWLRLAVRHPFVLVDEVTIERTLHDEQASRAAISMYRGMWRARHDALASNEIHSDPARRAAILAAVQRGAHLDLVEAWHAGDREAFDALLEAMRVVPLTEAVRRRWLRRRHAWPLWHALRRVKHGLLARGEVSGA